MHSPKETYGEKEIQLNYGVESNHLGNVLATISARPRLIFDNQTFQYKEADVISASDYYPFGMLTPARHWKSSTYRFGFGGYEKDDEVKGTTGSHYTTEARPYDPITGRWIIPDPKFKIQPGWSPYKAFLDNPILFQDPAGETEYTTTIITDEKTGKTISIRVPTANKLMTDGKKYEKAGMGDTWSYVNNYYDYEIINSVIIDKDGNKSVTTNTRIMYENLVKDKDNVWFGGDKAGDTKTDWSWNISGGVNFTWSLGQGQETRKAKFDVETVNIDDLMAVLGAAFRASGSKNPTNLAEPFKYFFDMIGAGMDATEVVQKTIEGVKDFGTKKGEQRSGETYKCPTCSGHFSASDTSKHNEELGRKSGPFTPAKKEE